LIVPIHLLCTEPLADDDSAGKDRTILLRDIQLLRNKAEIISASRHLEDFLDRDKSQPVDDIPVDSSTPLTVISRQESWATSRESQILYISEPFELGERNRSVLV